MNQEFLTVQEVAQRLRVSRQTVYGRINRGELSYIKVGGRVLISQAMLDKLIEKGTRPARTPYA
jgi:excisionase family DNA binding protein